MQQPPPPRPPQKKSDKGCLIALAVTGGVIALVVGVGAFGIYRFSQSKEGKMVFGAIGDMTKFIAEAQNAPGTKELRGMGCGTAMAMDVDEMNRIFEHFDASIPPSKEFSMMVVCQANRGTPPTCDDVARTYVAAAGPPARGFAVDVTRGGGRSGTVCSTLYDPDGTRVRDLAPGSTPTVPTGK
jgi:hypothetical protein